MCIFSQEEPITVEALGNLGWKKGKTSQVVGDDHIHMYLIENHSTILTGKREFYCSVLYTFTDGVLFSQYIVSGNNPVPPILIKTNLVTMNDLTVAVEYGREVVKDNIKRRLPK